MFLLFHRSTPPATADSVVSTHEHSETWGEGTPLSAILVLRMELVGPHQCAHFLLHRLLSVMRRLLFVAQIPAWKRDLTRDVPLQNIIVAYRRMAT